MALANRRDWVSDSRTRITSYAVVLRIVPGDASLWVEVEHAPDSAGAPDTGSAGSLGTVGPYPRQGGIFAHRVADDGATRWYRVRHVGLNLNPGDWTSWKSGVAEYVDPGILEAIVTGMATTHPIPRSIPMDDGDYAVRSTTSTGFGIHGSGIDSRGLPVNTMFGKTADDLDDVTDGSTYGKPLQTGLTTGQVDLSKAGVIKKHATYITRTAANSTALETIAQNLSDTGHAASGMQDSRSLAINTMFGKTADDLDDANDGLTYKKVTGVNGSNQVTPSSTVGRNRCKAYKTSSQSLTTASTDTLTWDAENFDVGSLHDTVTNNSRITIPTGGGGRAWLIHAQVEWQANGTGLREISIVKNNTSLIVVSRVPAAASVDLIQLISVVDVPADGDFYTVQARQTSGGNLNVQGASQEDSHFGAVDLW